MSEAGRGRLRRWHARWLLAVPVAGALWVPLYARALPHLGPFPFIVWFQFAWVVAAAGITLLVHLIEREADNHEAPEPGERL